jgi:DNA-binding IclR family transcriptional regulator
MDQHNSNNQTSASHPAAPPDDAAGDERYLVPALMRGLQVLQSLSGETRRLTLSELAEAIGVTRSSAYRLVYTLDHMGFLKSDAQTKTYALGPQALRIGYAYLKSRDLVAVAAPYLEQLRDVTGWSAHLGELQGRDVVYLARVATRRSVASNVQVGARLPAHATAMGRILLSALPESEVRTLYGDETLQSYSSQTPTNVEALLAQLKIDRSNGFVLQDSGFEPGVASVAAPVRDVAGNIVAAINVSAVTILTREGELHGSLKAEILKAADALSRDLGADRNQAMEDKA